MNSANFLTRENLERDGLGASDLEAFNRLRTRKGELTVQDFVEPPEGMSVEGAETLFSLFRESSSDIDRQLSHLFVAFRPSPPVADQGLARVAISYHSDIDRDFRTFETGITLRGASQVQLWDISHRHVISIEVTSSDGKVLLERTAIPLLDEQDVGEERLNGGWTISPPPGENEGWGPDGVGLYSRFDFPTRGRRTVGTIDPAPSRIHRTGRFQVMGQPQFRFDPYTFAVAFASPETLASLSSILGDGQSAHLAYFHPVDPRLSQIHEHLRLEPAALDFGGVFEVGPIERENVEAPGWVWILTGPDVVIGFEPDADLYKPRPDTLIILPGDQLHSSDGSVPYNVSEKGLLARPELFADDPGTSCRPFDQPGRVLGERRFMTAVRVTQPHVAGTKQGTIFSENIFERPVDYPRQPASDRREIDYELEDPATYQAKTVAFGHIIETAVRYRSNGYSLGDIAYSLTLAPRQKRRIVKLDYARRESAIRQEATMAEDQVADTVDHTRSYDNAVAASLDEWAQGRSRSSTTSAAAGVGFALPGFVAGGGAATSTSTSSSSQEGGRRTAASETQDLRDSIRRWGDSVRSLQSTVITESEQSESIEGVSEVVQNINYTRSLSVIYYEILRHLRIDTEISGVSECVHVPLPVREFTDERIRLHRDVLERYARGTWERLAFRYLDYLPDALNDSELPGGPRANQKLTSLSGSLWIRVGLGMPGEGEVAEAISQATDQTLSEQALGSIYQKAFSVFMPWLGKPLSNVISKKFTASPEARNRYFQSEIAPDMVRRYVDDLVLVDRNGQQLLADFTLVSHYRFGEVIRVDFTVDIGEEEVTRADLHHLRVRFNDDFIEDPQGGEPVARLPKSSFMDVTRATLRYANDFYEASASSDSGARDLVSAGSGEADPDGALLTFRLSHADKLNVHDQIKGAYRTLKTRLKARPFFYHKAIWWQMDHDELFTLLDGFAISDSDPRSLASVVNRRPLGIVGNCMVFRTTSDTPLDPMFDSFAGLKNHYVAGLRPSDPMRISLPTQGVYARAHLDGCVAAEEHNGSFDWVFDNVEPELANLPDSIFDSRRAQPQNMTPTPFPTSIINLQNAPDAPGVSGFDGVLGAVQNADAFRDMAGLAGTQANVRAGLNAAAGLATSFGGMAFQGAMAQLQADADAGKNLKSFMDALQKGVDTGIIVKETAQKSASDMAGRYGNGNDESQTKHQQELEREAIGGDGGGEVTETTKDGTRTVKKNPQPKSEAGKTASETAKPVGHVKWFSDTELLLYNFKVGDLTPELHADHVRALHAISSQISGVADIDGIEGRASATKSRTGDAQEKNQDLSIARMELVWAELMRFALDPQSNLQKQSYLGDNDPIRPKYSAALAGISDGVGGEDPVERSVLVRLARRVIPVPQPKLVPDIPEIGCIGHTVVIENNTILVQNNTIVNKVIHGDGHIVEGNLHIGDDLSGWNVESIDNENGNVTFGKQGEVKQIKAELSKDTPGKVAEISVDSKATSLWEIDLSNPRASGVSADELIVQLHGVLEAARATSASLPSSSASLAIPGDVASISLSNFNPNATMAEFVEKVFTAITAEGSTVGKTLRGLKVGTVELDVTIYAKPMDNPDRTDLWLEKKFTLSGPGLYYAREFENAGATIEGVHKFSYQSNTPRRMSDWGLLSELDEAKVTFKKGSIPGDATELVIFLTDLIALLNIPGADTLSGAVNGLRSILTKVKLATNLIAANQDLVFQPENEAEATSDNIRVGRSITAFELNRGTLRPK